MADMREGGFDLEQALTDNVRAPLANYAAGQHALALGNLARQRQLQDVASSQAFAKSQLTQSEQAEADREAAADARRKQAFIDESTYTNAQRLSDQYGLPTFDPKTNQPLPMDQQNALLKNYKVDSATKMFDFYKGQTDQAKDQVKDVSQQITDAASKISDAPARLAAARAALAAPSAEYIPADLKKMLSDKVATNQDPGNLVNEIAQTMQGRWTGSGGIGLHTTYTQYQRGAAFVNDYSTALQGIMGPQKSVQLAALGDQLQNANQQLSITNNKLLDHITQNTPFISGDQLKSYYGTKDGKSAAVGNMAGAVSQVPQYGQDGKVLMGKDGLPVMGPPQTPSASSPIAANGPIQNQPPMPSGSTPPPPAQPSAPWTGALAPTLQSIGRSIDAIPSYEGGGGIGASLGIFGGSSPQDASANISTAVGNVGRSLFTGAPQQPFVNTQPAAATPPVSRGAGGSWAPQPAPPQIGGGQANLAAAARPPTPDEVNQVKQLVMSKYQGNPDGIQRMLQGYSQGDPMSTKAFNLYLNEVRGGGSAMSAVSQGVNPSPAAALGTGPMTSPAYAAPQ